MPDNRDHYSNEARLRFLENEVQEIKNNDQQQTEQIQEIGRNNREILERVKKLDPALRYVKGDPDLGVKSAGQYDQELEQRMQNLERGYAILIELSKIPKWIYAVLIGTVIAVGSIITKFESFYKYLIKLFK